MVDTVAITGANGYVGSVVRRALIESGRTVISLTRAPDGAADGWRWFDLSQRVPDATLEGIDALVHCAYDMSATRPRDIWRVNVGGTRRLLEAAARAGVARCLVISSIAAFDGTRQLYGRAKLSIEAAARQHSAVVVRPGLVFGSDGRGGMIGALRAATSLPVIPVPAARSPQYCVHEDDLAAGVIALLSGARVEPPVVAAHPAPVTMLQLMATLAGERGAHPALLPVPWPPVYLALRAAELLPGRLLPIRADSLWGLSHPPPPPDRSFAHRTGVTPRPFPVA